MKHEHFMHMICWVTSVLNLNKRAIVLERETLKRTLYYDMEQAQN